ncbi:hypothetical protein A1O3_01547 [Capronia epimyces CBS 606.96]|uniref:Pre-rRNA-processing protein TSR2 n=1 Tax=Capronia epimyces CBS 606.96 TaxID=1182542 RepID=W9YUR2_9EURO|nr:uncharacterized protein A1O3_01547 [Capronia epimyces CBS 606.96]EXJ92991.1 hypothetical protein A1O3_01547 [Capronia epimyces CBS 606.96]
MAQVNGTSAQSPPTSLSSQIDLLVSLRLWSWPALTLAIQNAWGGSAEISTDKRAWMAGAVSDLLTSTPPQLADVGDLEEVLLQVMVDEFEVIVDDGSAEDTARGIWSGVEKLKTGDLAELHDLYAKWQEKQKKGSGHDAVAFVRGEDKDAEDTDWDGEDEDGDEEEWNGFPDHADVDMDEAPPLVDTRRPRQKIQPEVDDEGFTKVVGRKTR